MPMNKLGKIKQASRCLTCTLDAELQVILGMVAFKFMTIDHSKRELIRIKYVETTKLLLI
jgi:hypothetical protein